MVIIIYLLANLVTQLILLMIKKFKKYIILEGQNANKQASELLEAIPNKLKPNIVKAQYINNRRWDIYTKAKIYEYNYLKLNIKKL